MREDPESRLKRLRGKKNVLLEKLRNLPPTIRNADHKRTMLNDEINIITVRIMELQEKK